MSRDWQRDKPEPGRVFNREMPPVDGRLWAEMFRYLKTRDLPFMLAKNNGWYPSSDAGDAIPRVVVPATSTSHDNLFWQARALDEVSKRYLSPFAPRGDALIIVRPLGYHASAARSAWQEARRLIVEGPMDALAAADLGYYSIAWMGTDPTPDVLHLTTKLIRGRILTLLADRDAVSAMSRFIGALADSVTAVRLLVPPPPYKDLAAMPFHKRVQLLEESDGRTGS